tara:strand:- start:684 stop:905 length:222 start_codon:yes stop_codon:yes gene_type:complete
MSLSGAFEELTGGAKSLVGEVAGIPVMGMKAVANTANQFGNVVCRVAKTPGKGLGIIANTLEAATDEITGNGN